MAELDYDNRLIVIAGQSNAIGFAPVSSIASDLIPAITNARIFYGRGTDYTTYTWQPLVLGANNAGADGRSGTPFTGYHGCEMRLMKLLTEKYESTFNLLKVGEGGTSLGQDTRVTDGIPEVDWSPLSTGELYDISNGYETEGVLRLHQKPPAAYIWIQGEEDSNSLYSDAYQANLIEFISLKRAHFGSPNMPFLIARMGNLQTAYYYVDRDKVRAAQQYVCSNIPNCYLIDLDGLPTQNDHVHYTSDSYDTMGRRIFSRMVDILGEPVIVQPIVPLRRTVQHPTVIIAKRATTFLDTGLSRFNTAVLYKETNGALEQIILGGRLNKITTTEVDGRYLIVPLREVNLSEDDYKIGA